MRKHIGVAFLLALTGCGTNLVPRIDTPHFSPGGDGYRVGGDTPSSALLAKVMETGEASWYGPRHHGKPTASGEPFDMNAMSAAHATFPLGSTVLVTNLVSGRSVAVKINDRFPPRRGYVIDLSSGAAAAIGLRREEGHTPVALIPIDS
jgi:rare lipoprotein A